MQVFVMAEKEDPITITYREGGDTLTLKIGEVKILMPPPKLSQLSDAIQEFWLKSLQDEIKISTGGMAKEKGDPGDAIEAAMQRHELDEEAKGER